MVEATEAGGAGVAQEVEKGTEVVTTERVRSMGAAMRAGKQVMGIIPTSLAEVAKLALVISESGLAPYGLKTVQQITVAIMYGAELGLPPMQSLTSIAVINGRPSIYGDALIAIVRDSGLLERFKESFTGNPFDDNFTAHCVVKRAGEDEVEEVFSVADAKLAKLWMKRGGQQGDKDTPWVTHPKRMLRWRARGYAFHDRFADVLRGFRMRESTIGDDLPPDDPEPVSILSRLPGPGAATNGFAEGHAAEQTALAEAETAQNGVHSDGRQAGSGAGSEAAGGAEVETAPIFVLDEAQKESCGTPADEAFVEEYGTAIMRATTRNEVKVQAALFDVQIESMSPGVQALCADLYAARLADYPVKKKAEPQAAMKL